MSDWNDPDPSRSTLDFSRRQLLAGGGILAVVSATGGVMVYTDTHVTSEELVSFEGDSPGGEDVRIDAGVPLRVSAEVIESSEDSPNIVAGIRHARTEDLICGESGEESVTAEGRTENSGIHRMFILADGRFKATLTRRRDLF